MRRTAHGRAALELRLPVRHRLGAERQVVRAGLDGEPDALGLRRGDRGERVGGGEVDDVDAAAGLPGRGDHRGDRGRLGLRRAGGEEVVVRAARVHPVRGDDLGVLGVHDEQPVERGDLGHRRAQLGGRERRELRHPGVEQEALEAVRPGLPELGEVAEAVGHRAAPEADVDAAPALGGRPLGLRGPRREVVAGIGVERHVEQGRHPAGRRGPGRAGEALPLRTAGLVDVHVRVDQAGQEHLVVGQDDLRCRRPRCPTSPTPTRR